VSRKRGKQRKPAVEAIPDDILAEGSGPVGRSAMGAVATVEDVVTTDDIATTADVVTADDVVATAVGPEVLAADDGVLERYEPVGDDAAQLGHMPDEPPIGDSIPDTIGDSRNADAEQADAAGLDLADPDASERDADADPENSEDGGEGGGEGGEGGEGEEDDDAVIVFPTIAATMDAVQLKHLVEALIFASDRPLTVQRLRQLTRVGDVRRLEAALVEIAEDYRERGLVLQQVSGGYQFRTRTQFSAWVQQLIAGRPVRLSRAQLETLAIIAYRQPITRPEIDDIRGVDSTATLKLLIDRMLIRVLGKREEVGRPMLYGTTKEFLDFFSLGDLRELPTLREYSELTAESRKVMSDRLGIAPDGDDGDGSGGSGDGGGEGDGGAGDGGLGGEGGGGPLPGFEGDEGGAPANALASDLADAVATFLSAADVVERSNAAAMAELDDDDLPKDAPEDDAVADDALGADAALMDGGEVVPPQVAEAADAPADDAALMGGGEVVPPQVAEAADALAVGEAVLDRGEEFRPQVAAAADALAAGEAVDAANDSVDSEVAEVGGQVDGGGRVEAAGQVEGDPGWPAGSQRFAVMAAIDDHDQPAEPAVMDAGVIGAGAHGDGHGDAEAAVALTEPAAE